MSANNSPQETQGTLFETHVIPSGVTDPALHASSVELEAVPGGIFPDSPEQNTEPVPDRAVVQAVHKAVVTSNRHQGQIGKHSPLQREGSYGAFEVGDFLPGFGPVTHRNYPLAKQHAQQLDSRRQSS